MTAWLADLAATEQAASLTAAAQELETATATLNGLKQQLARFGPDEQTATAFDAAVSAKSAAEAAYATALQKARAAIAAQAAQMGGVDAAVLSAAMGNVGRDVPAKYRVLSLSGADWALLESALAQPSSECLSGPEAAVLVAADSNAAVSAAAMKLGDSNLMSMIDGIFSD